MKILYHHRTQGGGAEGVHIREIVTAFRSLGHEVNLISPPGVDPFSVDHTQKSEKSTKVSLLKKFILALPQIVFEFLTAPAKEHQIANDFHRHPPMR